MQNIDCHIIISHYNGNLEDWIHNLKYKYTIISKQNIPLETIPNKGNEVSGYLEYIINNYENLHEYTIFLHDHRTSWHCKENIDEKVNNIVFKKQYCNINDTVNIEKIGMYCELTQQYIPELINEIAHILDEPISINDLVYKQASQFYVHKNNILRHSKEKYIQLYNYLMNTNILTWLSSRSFEYTWHYIFTKKHFDESDL